MSLSVPMNSVLGRQYSRDSFDRFGDDLCQHLLSFLPIINKFRFECVSKQWKRLVFNKVIYFRRRTLRNSIGIMAEKQIKSILHKCNNLKTIELYVNQQNVSSLSLVFDNCQRLKSIKLFIEEEVSSEAINEFGQKFGSKVEVLVLKKNYQNRLRFPKAVKNFPLKCFQNLKRLKSSGDDWLKLIDNQLVPELNRLDKVWVESNRISSFTQLVDKYEKTLKNITVRFGKDCNINLIFQQLYRLKQLECLQIIFRQKDDVLGLTPILIALGENCHKLNKINIDIKFSTIALKPMINPVIGIKSFEIKSLVITCEMWNNFFDNLSELMPYLQELSIYLDDIFINNDLKVLSRLKYLKKLVLISNKHCINPVEDSGVIHLLDNCKELKELKLLFKWNITSLTIDKLKEVANNRPKDRIIFSTKGSEWEALRDSLIEKPKNLILNVIA